MKRLFRKCTGAALALLICGGLVLPAFAQGPEKEQTAELPEAKSRILVEMTTGKVLFEENADQPLPMASLTKLMGMILIGEAMDQGTLTMGETLTCSEYAKTMGGSEIWLKVGEQMTVEDLLKAVTIASANDAMVVFAEKLGTTEDGFVEMMNRKAEEMGLANTRFVNATGFDEEGHYTSARDVAKMALELQKYPQVTRFSTVWMDSLRGGETQLVNTNRLVRFYEGTTGLKTGTTDGAGHCLCATAKRGDLSLCAVVMGCKTSDGRFEESKELLNYGFANFTIYRPQAPDLTPLEVIHGMEETVPLRCAMPQGVVVTKEEAQAITEEIPQLEPVRAPVDAGQTLGRITILSQNKELLTYPIQAAKEVKEMNFGRCFGLLMKSLIAAN